MSVRPSLAHYVYILRDADGVALYVGESNNVERRLRDHARTKPWFGQVASVERESCPHFTDAYAREKVLVRDLSPVYNVIRFSLTPAARQFTPVSVRLTSDERQKVQALADEAGLTVSDYIRRCIGL